MTKVQELRDKSDEELEEFYLVTKKEIFELRGQTLDTKANKMHLIKEKRKDIARILTLKKENEKRQSS